MPEAAIPNGSDRERSASTEAAGIANPRIWASALHWHGITDAEAGALGYFPAAVLPGGRLRATSRGEGYVIVRLKDGRVNVRIDLEHVLTRGDPTLKEALCEIKKEVAERAAREAERQAQRVKLPENAETLMQITQGMDVDDLLEVYKAVKQIRAQRGMQAAQAARVVSIDKLREIRLLSRR